LLGHGFRAAGHRGLGSPSATPTISGRQLPPSDPAFGGIIEEKASESKAWGSTGMGCDYFRDFIGGDNGASAEGMLDGTPNAFISFNRVPVPVKHQSLWYELRGSDRNFPHFAAAWSPQCLPSSSRGRIFSTPRPGNAACCPWTTPPWRASDPTAKRGGRIGKLPYKLGPVHYTPRPNDQLPGIAKRVAGLKD